MISQDTKKLLQEVKDTPYRQALIEMLDDELHRMSDLMSFSGTMEEKGAQIQARQEAAKIIKKIFAFLDYSPSSGGKPKNQYL